MRVPRRTGTLDLLERVKRPRVPVVATPLGGGKEGPAGAAGRNAGLKYTYLTNTEETDPGAGKLKFNKATLSEATSLRISETDGDGNTLAALIATWDDSTSTTRGHLTMRKDSNPAVFAVFAISGAESDKGTWDTFTVALVASNGAFANNDVVKVEFRPKGDKGDQGEKGEKGATGAKGESGGDGSAGRSAGLAYSYSTNTEETDPTSGFLKLNKAPASITEATSLRISETDTDGNVISALLATFDDSTSPVKGTLTLRKQGTPGTFAAFNVTGALVDKGTWDVLPVEHVAHGGAFGNLDAITVEFSRTGNQGATGKEGPPGADGGNGEKGEQGLTGTGEINCRLATAAALAAYTRSTNVLTANANGALAPIDGVTPAVNDFVLLKNGAASADNGVYKVTSLGSGSAKWTMERIPSMDTSAECVPGMLITVAEGTENADSIWQLTTNGPITLNTTALTFAVAAIRSISGGGKNAEGTAEVEFPGGSNFTGEVKIKHGLGAAPRVRLTVVAANVKAQLPPNVYLTEDPSATEFTFQVWVNGQPAKGTKAKVHWQATA